MMKKVRSIILLLSFMCLYSCNYHHDPITGNDLAEVIGISCDLSIKEKDFVFSSSDIIMPSRDQVYDLEQNVPYTLRIALRLGNGSIPPKISNDSFIIDYNENLFRFEKITLSDEEENDMSYVNYYHFEVVQNVIHQTISFRINEITTTIILNAR